MSPSVCACGMPGLQGVAARVLDFPIGGATQAFKLLGSDKAVLSLKTTLAVRLALRRALGVPCHGWMLLLARASLTIDVATHARSQVLLHVALHALQEEPSADVVARIAAEVNAAVAADLPVCRFTMDRAAADAAYGNAYVERLSAPPLGADVTSLQLAYIPNLLLFIDTVPLLPSTAFVGALEIEKVRPLSL